MSSSLQPIITDSMIIGNIKKRFIYKILTFIFLLSVGILLSWSFKSDIPFELVFTVSFILLFFQSSTEPKIYQGVVTEKFVQEKSDEYSSHTHFFVVIGEETIEVPYNIFEKINQGQNVKLIPDEDCNENWELIIQDKKEDTVNRETDEILVENNQTIVEVDKKNILSSLKSDEITSRTMLFSSSDNNRLTEKYFEYRKSTIIPYLFIGVPFSIAIFSDKFKNQIFFLFILFIVVVGTMFWLSNGKIFRDFHKDMKLKKKKVKDLEVLDWYINYGVNSVYNIKTNDGITYTVPEYINYKPKLKDKIRLHLSIYAEVILNIEIIE